MHCPCHKKTKVSFSIVIYQHQRGTNKRKDQVPTLMNNILYIGCCVPSKASVQLPIITFSVYAVFYTKLSIFIIIVLFSEQITRLFHAAQSILLQIRWFKGEPGPIR